MSLAKKVIAKAMGISRQSIYYENIQPIKDLIVRQKIEAVIGDRKTYGSRRIAHELKQGKNSILRVMKKFNLLPVMRKKRFCKKADKNKGQSSFSNLIEGIKALCPNHIWAVDFTYIRFQTKFIYFATVIDLFTREIVGWSIRSRHVSELVISAMDNAFSKGRLPDIVHSDQGSEYRSRKNVEFLQSHKIAISMSKKGSPWENAFQESFYSQFKLDFGDVNRFESLGELIESLGTHIKDYNEHRLHSSLEMTPPAVFRREYEAKNLAIDMEKAIMKRLLVDKEKIINNKVEAQINDRAIILISNTQRSTM